MLLQPLNLPGQAPGVQGTKLCHLLSDETLLRRLSGNTGEDCVSALRALNLPDSFWTDEFKVVPCAKTYSHKWTLCPCAHIGETARRRCPRTVNYKAVLCPLVKAKKTCPLGDSCTYAHNVFEHWLHPSRYKTRLCSFGRSCNRSICFFAHSADELRCVPCTDDKDGDERDYLMQLFMAQESGLLSASTVQQLHSAPMPPPLVPGLMPDLTSALHQALQQPLPSSNRPSVNGLPDTSTIMSAGPSMSGISDVNALSARASLSGLPDTGNSAAVLAARASFSGVADGSAASMFMSGRPSMNGLPDSSALLAARTSLNGLQDSVHRARPSLSGLPDPTTNMLLSMSVQSNVAAMQRALSSELTAPFHAAAMQRALSSDLGQAPMNAAAAAAAAAAFTSANANAAAVAMERAFSAGAGSASPLQSAAAAAAAMERAYSLHSREPTPSPLGVGGAGAGMERAAMLQTSRSMGSGGARRELSLAHTPSINSVESDSVVQLRQSAGMVFGGGRGGSNGAPMFVDPQAPPRLSDPGASFQVPVGKPILTPHLGGISESGNNVNINNNGNFFGPFGSQDLANFESLLPLVNNALATGALPMPSQQQAAAAVRRSISGSQSSDGRVVSPPLREAAGSPCNSDSLISLSPNASGEAANILEAANARQQQHQLQHGGSGSPPKTVDGLSYEGLLQASAAAAAADAARSAGAVNALAGGAADQAYLQDLVARLQGQGVNKEQLVSSLSHLLAQLLSVGN